MSGTESIAAIVLCAGKGKRMQAPRTPKVCFPVAGKPAIVHLLERLDEVAAAPTILVVGHLAGMVVEEVGPRFPGVEFSYQPELLGTGIATKQGAQVLQRLDFEGAVLVVAGDKVIEAAALDKLIAAYTSERPDLALIAAPREHWPNAGRIVMDSAGQVERIIERRDLAQAEAMFTVKSALRTRSRRRIDWGPVVWVMVATSPSATTLPALVRKRTPDRSSSDPMRA